VLALCLWASGAPSIVYPLYATQWGLTPTATTAVFATYPVVLVLVLVLFGNLSDHIGRRATILVGLSFLLLGALSFAVAPDVGWLFAGRALQGIGVGFSVGAASAALVEYNPGSNTALPGSVNTASQSAGLVLCTLVGGALTVLAPAPLHLSYWVLVLLVLLVAAACMFLPERDRATMAAGRWRPPGLRVPRTLIGVYAVSALAVTAAFAMGALFLGLGAQIARDVVGSTSVLLVGAVLSCSYLVIGVTAVAASRLRPRSSVAGGAVAAITGLTLLFTAAQEHAFPVFVGAAVVCGLGYGLSMSGGLAVASIGAPAHHRARLLSAVFLAAYLVQGSVAFGAGLTATHTGLQQAIALVIPLVGALSLVSLVAVTWIGRRAVINSAATSNPVTVR
jgi:hypothetical protein